MESAGVGTTCASPRHHEKASWLDAKIILLARDLLLTAHLEVAVLECRREGAYTLLSVQQLRFEEANRKIVR